jgi:hypothetical protein
MVRLDEGDLRIDAKACGIVADVHYMKKEEESLVFSQYFDEQSE